MNLEKPCDYQQLFSRVLKQYRLHHLTDFLQTLSDAELEAIECVIVTNDIEGEKIGIYGAVINELEYRKSNKEFEQKILIKMKKDCHK